ncbi:MAG TPA: hypothetical protein VJU84_11600 [Pyrinomonadaceae bacterium]|nr:hypothetical protein [Pyrinomonadaceae bacterium]
MPKLLSLEDVNSDFDLLRFFMDPVIQRAVQPQRIMIITDDLHLYAAAELGNQLTYYEWPLTLFTASNESRSELSSYLRWFEPTVMFLDADKTLLEGMGHPSLKYIFTFNQIGRGPEIRHINHIYDILRDELAGPIAIACDRSYQYIFDSSLFYFETGQDGRLLVTSLFNQLQPLIRYALPYTATLLSSSTFRIDPNSLDNV